MSQPYILRNQNGLSILEFLIASFIVSVSIAAALALMQVQNNSAAQAGAALRLLNIRSTILAELQNDVAWFNTVGRADNTSLDCLRNGGDCRNVSGPIALYSAGNVLVYDGLSPSSGFTINGTPCNTYDGAAGNSECPIHLDLVWTAKCNAAGSCLNPLTMVTGTFVFKSNLVGQLPKFSGGNLSFSYHRQKGYCVQPLAAYAVNLVAGALNIGANSVAAVTNGASYGAGDPGEALTSVIEACNSTIIEFNYDQAGVGNLADLANQASLCFEPSAGGVCVYEWYQQSGSWVLRQDGVTVYTPPVAEATIVGGSSFKFSYNNGLMIFYFNNVRKWTFAKVYSTPTKLRYHPGSQLYSPLGFNNINFSSL